MRTAKNDEQEYADETSVIEEVRETFYKSTIREIRDQSKSLERSATKRKTEYNTIEHRSRLSLHNRKFNMSKPNI
jgi:hypothetical protein